MDNNQNYQSLTRTFTRLSRFQHLSAIAGWDMFAMMPPGGSTARGEALAELGVLQHQILTDKKVGDWLRNALQEELNDVEQANLREMTRQYQQAALLPESLVEAKALAGSKCEHAWRTQRPANDWAGFSANLKEVVKLSREEAKIRAQAKGCSPYDALLDIFEPDMTSARLDVLFADLKSWLPDLLQRVVDKQSRETLIAPVGPFPVATQRELGLEAMTLLGFDFNAGRLDVSAHPFCGGVPEDVRITTRYDENELLSALFGVVHETGHARYEQNLPRQWLGQPVALARSTAIHESQSLFFEMQLGRSEAFLKRLLPAIIQHFGAQPAFEESNFIAWNQRVKPGFIRVDADEVSYPAHVILRYEIERALINGEIEVDDIPALWNEKMQAWLGLSTEGNYRNGCMQDIHWTDGGFGYFPSYTLGAMYAAQLFQAARNALPGLDEAIAQGDFSALFDWLRQNIWQHGSRFSTSQLIEQATGEALNSRYFRQHLTARYL
ncbi:MULTISPECIES: carboxypeptidase M32 [Enterobacteriaceae]|jgi:carboxypeptidase Taq|uniref:carboxypeptidase M32 n=1 Tax=Enterobacteriaceae TaxID=543 RepID=UPI000892C232|nr:carboxypeptidase M32 [Phytobacter diazotrophicus]AUU91230.1 carboxypeptidase M32 [Enterobacteriaceae bacterium ENNIH3]AUV08752.1 carboxypeptidase M32 [Enterobacteriaceae bacterium ENNIH2]MDU4241576.1 carboxypeptidase M32 [Bifidobacterium longum]MDU4999213.1 carboxypeptidase M32 [Enterobacteriaceae bacterium]PTA91070.1 carboxypeptidase M32 [Kluyvera sp. Nf5]PWF50336.1 carboxypeptidase M32 [[Kluyvera] intestini]